MGEVRRRLGRWTARLTRRAGRLPAPPDRPYPDYVVCPYCSEPEVEVWCYSREARCHNCGRTFEHRLPPECVAECPQAE